MALEIKEWYGPRSLDVGNMLIDNLDIVGKVIVLPAGKKQ